jgi:hypothetical protein
MQKYGSFGIAFSKRFRHRDRPTERRGPIRRATYGVPARSSRSRPVRHPH